MIWLCTTEVSSSDSDSGAPSSSSFDDSFGSLGVNGFPSVPLAGLLGCLGLPTNRVCVTVFVEGVRETTTLLDLGVLGTLSTSPCCKELCLCMFEEAGSFES